MAKLKNSYLDIGNGYSCRLIKNSKREYTWLGIKKPDGEASIPLERIKNTEEKDTLIELIEKISGSGDGEIKLKPQLLQLIKTYVICPRSA